MKYVPLIWLLVLCLISPFVVDGQDTLYVDEFLNVVKQNHPLLKKAALFEEIGDAYIQKARGTLDPKLSSDYQRKFFDNTDYFRIWQSEAKIPTKYPIDFALGYENNSGQFLNESLTVPANGLVYGTINISLIRGLLFDQQRFDLALGKLNEIKSTIDEDILERDVTIQALVTYLAWSIGYYDRDIKEEFLQLILARHQNIVDYVLNGDKPAIDTIESQLNINTAEKLVLESIQNLITKEQKLSVFLWNDNGQLLTITEALKPMRPKQVLQFLNSMLGPIDRQFINDPLLQKIENQKAVLALSNKLEKESLKPRLDLKYNTLLNMGKADFDPSFSLNDYKYGIGFDYPILNRKTRGQIRLNEAMIDQLDFDQNQYTQELYTKYDALIQNREVQEEMLSVLNEKLQNSQALYNAEILKFNIGESSVFLLNQRERKVLESQIDQLKGYYYLGNTLTDLYYLRLGQE